MSEPKKVGRRSFLNYAIAVVATGVIVGAATYLATPKGATTTVTAPAATTTVTAPGATTTVVTTVTTPVTTSTVTLDEWAKEVSKPYKGETIKIVTEGTPPSQWVNRVIVPKFKEITGINVIIELLSWDDAFRKAVMDAEAKAGNYDMYYCDMGFTVASWTEKGYIEDMYKMFELHPNLVYPNFNLNDIITNRFWTYQGKLAGFSFEHFLKALWYRKDLFEDPNERSKFKA